MRNALLTALTTASLLAMACSTTQTVSLLSTRNVDLSAPHDVVARAESKSDGRLWLLFIPLGGKPNAIRTANKLLEGEQGDYLTNVVIKDTGWSLIALSWGSVSVKGDVYRRAQ